ncbi:hypothetical protein [Paraburkholderia aromaticivorans]|uniref:hypothetical protein n=1 Tax=Paraburkholderia aromaticivorans TaxID=2026199 RepID=UPI0038BC3F44
MQIDKVDANAYGDGIHLDVYFKLTRSEVDTLSSPTTQAAISAALTATAAGAPAIPFVLARIDQIKEHNGPNGCSIKMTVVNSSELREFLTDAI